MNENPDELGGTQPSKAVPETPKKRQRSLNAGTRAKIKEKREMTCELCGRVREKKNLLEVHHIDGNKRNNADRNLMVVCGGKAENNCHKKLHDMLRKSSLDSVSLSEKVGKRVREKNIDGVGSDSIQSKEVDTALPLLDGASSPSDSVKKLVDYQSGSAEMQGNDYFEIPYWRWLIKAILHSEEKRLGKNYAINAGAWSVGCSPTTSRKYYEKIVSGGPLVEFKDEFKRKCVKVRAGCEGQAREVADMD